MRSTSFVGVVVVGILLALGAHEACCASNSTIVFGMSAPRNTATHPAAHLAVQFASGINLAFKEVNEKYGGVNGHQLVLLVQEDNNTLANTMANVANMIDNLSVFAIAGVIGAEQSQGPFAVATFLIFPFVSACCERLCDDPLSNPKERRTCAPKRTPLSLARTRATTTSTPPSTGSNTSPKMTLFVAPLEWLIPTLRHQIVRQRAGKLCRRSQHYAQLPQHRAAAHQGCSVLPEREHRPVRLQQPHPRLQPVRPSGTPFFFKG